MAEKKIIRYEFVQNKHISASGKPIYQYVQVVIDDENYTSDDVFLVEEYEEGNITKQNCLETDPAKVAKYDKWIELFKGK